MTVDGAKRKRRTRNDLRAKWYAVYRTYRFSYLGVAPPDRVIDIHVVCAILVKRVQSNTA